MSRNSDWNINRTFKRGEVYFVNLPEEPQLDPNDSYVLRGEHRVVVLFDSEYPRNTVTILPISSLHDSSGNRKETIATDYILSFEDYEGAEPPYHGTIKRDSFIKMDQIRSISRHYLERCVGELLPDDLILIDLRLIASLQLQDTVNTLIESEIQKDLPQRTNKKNQRHNFFDFRSCLLAWLFIVSGRSYTNATKGNFLLLDKSEFRDWLKKQVVTRSIKTLQVHHTALPNYTTRQLVNGVAKQDVFKCLEGMRNSHLSAGWSQLVKILASWKMEK